MDAAQAVFAKASEASYLDDLPRDLRRRITNFAPREKPSATGNCCETNCSTSSSCAMAINIRARCSIPGSRFRPPTARWNWPPIGSPESSPRGNLARASCWLAPTAKPTAECSIPRPFISNSPADRRFRFPVQPFLASAGENGRASRTIGNSVGRFSPCEAATGLHRYAALAN